MELRCDNGILHGTIRKDSEIEFRCRSKRCGHESGVIVIHTFNTKTGELVKTNIFADPIERSNKSGTTGICSAIRSA